MAPKRDLLFRYLGDPKSLVKASGRAERALGGVDQKSKKTGKGLKRLQGTASKLGIALGLAGLAGQARVSVNRAEEMNSAYAATEQILVATGGAAGLTGRELKGLAVESSLLTGVDKALVIEGQNILLTFKNIRQEVGEGNDIFTRAQDVMLDFAAVMKTDAKSGAVQLGKALNDPIKGITALGRVGVQFTDVQREQIRLFVESGDIMGAQKVILEELEGQVGGVAAATADSTAKISNAWKEVQEQIGNVLLPAIDAIVPAMQAVGREAPSATRKIGLGFAQARRIIDSFAGALDVATGPVFNIGDAWGLQEETLFQVNKRMVQYTEALAEGRNESNLFVSVLADLTAKGDDYFGSLKTLIQATGIQGEAFKTAAVKAIGMRDELGLTEEQVSNLKRELQKLEMGTSTMSIAAANAEGDLGGLGDGLGEVSTKGADALAAIKKVNMSLREMADPVFKAIQETARFEEILERVQEDLVVTSDEADELNEAYGRMVEAQGKISADSIDAYEKQGTAAFRRLDEATVVSGDLLTNLPFLATAGFDATTRAFQRFIDQPLQVRVAITQPSARTMDRLVREALTRNGRRQTGF